MNKPQVGGRHTDERPPSPRDISDAAAPVSNYFVTPALIIIYHEDCKLYPFRDGHNPYTQRREMTPEQKAALAERMRNIRNTKG